MFRVQNLGPGRFKGPVKCLNDVSWLQRDSIRIEGKKIRKP